MCSNAKYSNSITDTDKANTYKKQLRKASDYDFEPLIPCYLNENLNSDDFRMGLQKKIFFGSKLYPTNATNNSKNGVSDISKIFKEAIDNAPTKDSFEIYRETVSLEDQKDFILQGFKTEKVLSLKKLVKKLETKIEIIVTFLALLEMIKKSVIFCLQKENFKDIEIKLIIAEA